MQTNDVLILALIATVVIILFLKNRVDRLSQDMQGQAMLLFNAWKSVSMKRSDASKVTSHAGSQ